MAYKYRDIMDVYREVVREIEKEKRVVPHPSAVKGREKSELSEIRSSPRPVSAPSKPSKALQQVFESLERRCPEYVEAWRWQQAVDDGRRFLGQWGDQAAALGWTSTDLFALHEPPVDAHPSYDRLGRFDCLGLVWVLEGRPVTMLSSESALIKTTTGT